MRKLLVLLFSLILMSNGASFASGIEIEPTMQTRTNAQDRVWVGTFQLVWNDFMDKIVHNPVRFREGSPVMVQELNIIRMEIGNMKAHGKMVNQMEEEYRLMRKGIRNMKENGRMV